MLGFVMKLGQFVDKVARGLTQLCVAIMVVAVVLQVIWRYFLGNPIIWAEELARYALVWMTFIGAAVALRAGQLACMDLVVNLFPVKIKRAIITVANLASFILLLLLLYYSVILVGEPSVVAQRSPAMRITMSYIYLAIPIGLGLMVTQSLLQLFSGIIGKGSEPQ